MITFLSGGTGTPKLLQGMRRVLGDEEISVVVNTAEDIWISGNHLAPDLDTVMYLFSGDLDTRTWWGVEGDTYITHEKIGRLGGDEFIAIGDLDRAVHIARGGMMREGKTLTEATRSLCSALGIRAEILPMADTPVTTRVMTPGGELHFQEYWVKQRGSPIVEGVKRTSDTPPLATHEVIRAIHESEAVIIGPSNPVTSILPILECRGVSAALENRAVLAVSPFIGDAPVSGPAGVLMRAIGYEPTSLGTYRLYERFSPIFVQDIRDPVTVPGGSRADTLMTDTGKSEALSRKLLDLISSAR
jgi:LPPG:FO 2-phospho-L-lactate transferase